MQYFLNSFTLDFSLVTYFFQSYWKLFILRSLEARETSTDQQPNVCQQISPCKAVRISWKLANNYAAV